jgi:hypothetical protein
MILNCQFGSDPKSANRHATSPHAIACQSPAGSGASAG